MGIKVVRLSTLVRVLTCEYFSCLRHRERVKQLLTAAGLTETRRNMETAETGQKTAGWIGWIAVLGYRGLCVILFVGRA